MATRERESAGRPFGIAHATVVPTNFDPERSPGGRDRPDESPADESGAGTRRADSARRDGLERRTDG